MTDEDRKGEMHVQIGARWRKQIMPAIDKEFERDPNLDIHWEKLGPNFFLMRNRKLFEEVFNTPEGRASGNSGLTYRLTITRKDTGETLVNILVDLIFRESKSGWVPVKVPRQGKQVTLDMVELTCTDRWVLQLTGTATPKEEGREIQTITHCRLHPLFLYPQELMYVNPDNKDRTAGHVLVDHATVTEPWHLFKPDPRALGLRKGLYQYLIQRVQGVLSTPVRYEKSSFRQMPTKRAKPNPRMNKLRG